MGGGTSSRGPGGERSGRRSEAQQHPPLVTGRRRGVAYARARAQNAVKDHRPYDYLVDSNRQFCAYSTVGTSDAVVTKMRFN